MSRAPGSTGSERSLRDPEVEQAQIAQDAVEKLKGKGAVGRTE